MNPRRATCWPGAYLERACETAWTPDELARIAEADDLHISPFRADGVTYGTPTWIWSVVVGNDLLVRAYNGQKSRWYQAAVEQKAGRISVAGMMREVRFEPSAGTPDGQIDEAYRKKYAQSGYLGAMTGIRARAATIRIVPTQVL